MCSETTWKYGYKLVYSVFFFSVRKRDMNLAVAISPLEVSMEQPGKVEGSNTYGKGVGTRWSFPTQTILGYNMILRMEMEWR